MTDSTETHGCETMAQRTEAHERLEPFVGTFKAEVKMWFGPGEPHVSTGTMVNELDLDGRFLKQSYAGDATDGPFPNFMGRGYWGYNTVTNEYEGFWIDTASTFMQTERGNVDGDVWTMTGSMTNPQTGEPMTKTSIIRLESNDKHSMEMYFDMPGMGECKTMEIQYTRA